MRLPRGLSRLLLLAASLASGCASTEAPVTRDDDVTNVANTDVRKQSLANCWTFATAAWVESLHKSATSRDLDVSEAYWNYWYWYEQITGGDLVGRDWSIDQGLLEGGWWGTAVELTERYGWMRDADFVTAPDRLSSSHERAAARVRRALSSGTLARAEGRNDPRVVRDELNRAWSLTPAVIDELERLFPIAAPTGGPPARHVTITSRAARGALGTSLVHAPQELEVLSPKGRVTSLDAVLGTRSPGTQAYDGLREGDEAWSQLYYRWTDAETVRRDAILANVVDVLNRRLAVPFGWVTGKYPQSGVYRGPAPEFEGLHASLVVDYEARAVPGFGDLPVGVPETRPAALEAVFADPARVTLLRIKNSWGPGAVGARAHLPTMPGFNDLERSFFDASIEAWAIPTSPGLRAAYNLSLPNVLRVPIPPRTVTVAPALGR